MNNINDTQLKIFELPNGDVLSLWVVAAEDTPLFYVKFNNEIVGVKRYELSKADETYQSIWKVLSIQHDASWCDWCGNFVIGTKRYAIGEDGFIEKLCLECLKRAKKDYRSVVEVIEAES